jgi:hypothetical protein
MSDLAAIASTVSAGATCVALVFAGLELRRSRAQDLRKRRVEIEGVAVSWIPTEVPRVAQDGQGQASWVYEFTASNPGPLPVSDVRVEIFFALKVQRVHYDGHLDDPVDTLVLVTPVIAGGGERTWRRRLLLDYSAGAKLLRKTRADISFIDPDDPQQRQTNSWPKHLTAAESHDVPPGGADRDIGASVSSGNGS